MEVKAITKFTRISPKKARPMARALQGTNVVDAMNQMKFHRSKTAQLFYKLIKSAVSNASNNYNLKEDNLRIKTLTVDTGPTLKRYWFRSHGSADPLLKRSSHFAVTVEEIKPSLVKKPVAKTAITPASVEPTTTSTTDVAAPSIATQIKSTGPKPKFTQGLKKVLTRRTTNK
jgi:large subunit ribosomal protein L22